MPLAFFLFFIQQFWDASLIKQYYIQNLCYKELPVYVLQLLRRTPHTCILLFYQAMLLFFYFSIIVSIYSIWLNNRTVRLGFSKILRKLEVKYVPTHTNWYTLKTKISEGLIKWCLWDVFVFFFLLIFFIKAYVLGTHLNCIDKSMQFKWVPTTYTFIKKKTKSTLAVIWRLWNCLTVRL